MFSSLHQSYWGSVASDSFQLNRNCRNAICLDVKFISKRLTTFVSIQGWVFLPVYMASGVYTMPEYMKRRFGGRRIQLFLATISMFGYVFTKISVSLVAGATFIQQVFKWNIYLSILALLAITALFTIAGL